MTKELATSHSAIANMHSGIHLLLADYYQQLADYHAAKAKDPVSEISIPEKPLFTHHSH